MQITYTHINGQAVTYTANTAVTTTLQICKVIPGVTTAETIARWDANVLLTPTVDPTTGDKLYVHPTTTFITDYGFGQWAEERLSPSEYATYLEQQVVWNSDPSPNQHPYFVDWWSKFLSDPHVAFNANV